MNISRLTGDFGFAVLAQGFSALASTLLTLGLPKVLGVDGFGFWQLFIFYAGYIGFFTLGLNDGVYLEHGGTLRKKIAKAEINSQFLLSTTVQFAASIPLMAAALLLPIDGDRAFVLFATAALIAVNNAGVFLGYLFQAMSETRLFSLSVAIESGVLLAGIISLLTLGIADYKPYVILYFGSKVVRLAFCCSKSIDFIKTRPKPINEAAHLSYRSIKIGIKLMIANTAGSLILGVTRFLIDANWGIETFSSVSFALSIASFFMLFISQVSMVLFPALRQTDENEASAFYEKARGLLNVILPTTVFLYWPSVLLLNIWLPDYSASFTYFAFVLPLCVYEGKMDILGTTYLKVFRQESKLLAINVGTLIASTLFTFAGIYIANSIEITLICIVAVLGLRELFAEAIISKRFNSRQSPMSWATLLLCLFFSITCITLPPSIGAIAYLIIYIVYIGIFRKERSLAISLLTPKAKR